MIDYFEKQQEEINHALHTLDPAQFDRWISAAAETVGGGHKIIASGLGKNVPICEKFVGSMVSMGFNAAFLHTNSAVHGDLGLVKAGDMVILLTKSGETSESIYLARLLRKRAVQLWLLTFEKESTLARELENVVVLELRHEGDLWNIMPNNSTTLNLMVLQGLAIGVAKRFGVTLEEFRNNHPGGHIGQLLNRG